MGWEVYCTVLYRTVILVVVGVVFESDSVYP